MKFSDIYTETNLIIIFFFLQANTCLKSIDLSWNGLGYEGILALCEALRINTTLQIINLSNNRINWKAAEILGITLQRNKTLQALKVSYFNKVCFMLYSV
jgi:Ran GTPase-activating protein (RanGAP) involved in mRNA processing and transport